MRKARLITGILVLASVGLAGCADKGLRSLSNPHNGPDEFLVTPSKPLETPGDLAFLPAPTPGGKNRTDQRPREEAVETVGGDRRRMDPNAPISGSDAALVTAASRNGVEPGVRENLAAEDAKFRKRQSRLSSFKIFRVDRYEQAYRRQTLNPFEAAVPYRRAGLPTPSAPPYDE